MFAEYYQANILFHFKDNNIKIIKSTYYITY